MNTKWKVILSVMLLIMIICVVFIGLLARNCRINLDEFIVEQVKNSSIVAQVIEEQQSRQYRKRIKSLINPTTSPAREQMLAAFARRDRETLYQLVKPIFETLSRESRYLSTLGWVLPDNHALLRVHNLKRYGDDVSAMRPDIVAANRELKQYSGYTVGFQGLQYRIVQPVQYEGKHLGTLQLGLDDSLLLDPIRDKLGLPVWLVVPNEHFSYIKNSELLNLPGKTHTIQGKDLSLFEGMTEFPDWSLPQYRIEHQGRDFIFVKVLDLADFRGEVEGAVFVALDVSAAAIRRQQLIVMTVVLSVVMLFLSFLILYTSYGGLVEKIVNLNDSLEKSNHELEDRVRERTGKLLEEIEQRKVAEKERAVAVEKAQRSCKMEAIGLMAGGVAHDLNNILSGVVSYPELILMQLSEDSDLRKPVEAILDSGQRAAMVVADLLTVARGVACEKDVVNLNDLLDEYIDSPEYKKIKHNFPQVSCQIDCDAELFNSSCSAVHVKKCMMNLVNNSFEAITGEGTIIVSTRNQYVDKPVAENQYMERGEYVVLAVADSGHGIPDKDIDHIFEPFYTKKQMGSSGTGLGLAIVWNTVHDHNGAVTVASSEKGTIFELYFPAVREDVSKLSDHFDLEGVKGNGQLVLVVDDEEQQREVVCQMLELLGYQADSAASGEEAVAYIQEKKVDILVLDMVMDPGINGRETFERILEFSPGQKAIIASGFSETAEVQRVLELGACLFMRKPYTIYQFALALKQGLEEK